MLLTRQLLRTKQFQRYGVPQKKEYVEDCSFCQSPFTTNSEEECVKEIVYGCTVPEAVNYDIHATEPAEDDCTNWQDEPWGCSSCVFSRMPFENMTSFFMDMGMDVTNMSQYGMNFSASP